MTVLGSVLSVGAFGLLLSLWAWADAYGRKKLAAARRGLAARDDLGRKRIGL